SPIRGDSEAPMGVVLVFRNVTERKQAEEAQARLAAIVESSDDAIVSKTLDGVICSWNPGAERLFGYARNEAIGRPITLIIPPERLDEEQEILARISRGERVEHFDTVRVIDDLLDISRISQNKMELRRSHVVLTDVISSALETARPAIEAAGHEITVSLPPEPVHLAADLTRLSQVFSNLLINSAKYTE